MLHIQLVDMSEYPVVVREILENGISRSPRGLASLDAGYTVVEIMDPRGGLPLGLGRSISKAIGAVEALQLIGGQARPNLVTRIAPQFKRYMDNGDFHGNYGRRMRMQLPNVYRKLKEDPNTRQAVITLWDPALDNIDGKHDYPCTVALHFYTDEHTRLCLNVTMRSNDVWLGFPYDVFQFTQLQLTLANVLGMPFGPYQHTTWSMHLYKTDLEAADTLVGSPEAQWRNTYDSFDQPHGINDGTTIDDVMRRARLIMDEVNPSIELTTSERWYHDVIHTTPKLV